jgi:aspartate/methionine/tyrosine aminotransferase
MSHKVAPAERIRGIKPSKIREILDKVADVRRRGIEIADFSIGRPDFDTPSHIKRAAKRALDDGLVHYTASAGLIELREAICKRFQDDFDIEVDPEEVIVTIGATEAIYAALQVILNPGDEVVVPQPMYVYYRGWSLLSSANFVTLPLIEKNDFLFEAEEVKKVVTSKTKVIIVNSPHNPSGQVFEKEELIKLAKLAISQDFFVISDDIYNYLTYDDVKHFSIAKVPGMKERTFIIGSFSKTYAMDGWRIGYLIAPRHLVSDVLKMHQHLVSCPNTFVQVGARAALTASQDCVHHMVEEFDRRRGLLLSYLDDIGLPYIRPRGAFYVFPSIKKFGLTSGKFCDFLLNKAQVAAVPGVAFGTAGEGHIRLAYSTSYEEIIKGMERARIALRKLPQ